MATSYPWPRGTTLHRDLSSNLQLKQHKVTLRVTRGRELVNRSHELVTRGHDKKIVATNK